MSCSLFCAAINFLYQEELEFCSTGGSCSASGGTRGLAVNSCARVTLAVIGSTIGVLGAMGLARLLRSAFPGMEFDSALVMTGTTAFLIAIALIACYLPARHASRISPVEALRSDA